MRRKIGLLLGPVLFIVTLLVLKLDPANPALLLPHCG